MEYTQDDVTRILEASEKATKGKWHRDIVWGYIRSEDNSLIVDTDATDDCKFQETIDNAELIAGAPILAEEVKRLRRELKDLNELFRAEIHGF
jgi:hypothetical protein